MVRWDSCSLFDLFDFLIVKKNVGNLFISVYRLMTGVLISLSFYPCLLVMYDFVFGCSFVKGCLIIVLLLDLTLTVYRISSHINSDSQFLRPLTVCGDSKWRTYRSHKCHLCILFKGILKSSTSFFIGKTL